MLVGRHAETALIDDLLETARGGRSASLVLRGEAGIGKSALLAYAAEHANDMTVLRAVGVQSESDLAFAGLHQLLRPIFPSIDRLPQPQALALRAAFALTTDTVDDRFRVAIGVLGLLTQAAEESPLVCLIDDAQWLDRSSADALLFAGRRLDVDAVALLLACRDSETEHFEASGLDDLQVGGLAVEAAGQLVDSLNAEIDPLVRDHLVDQAAGNALALVELPAALSARQLTGADPLPPALPLPRDVERLFLQRVRQLPEGTQRLLTVVAADDGGSLAAVMRAADQLGIDTDSLVSAERAGLVVVDGHTIQVRHPLVRSAIYQGVSSSERRSAHEALAEAMSRDVDSDRRAWHRAAAAEGPDEAVAMELESSAERARLRGGHSATAAALEKAAELSVDFDATGRRLLAAATAAWHAGEPARATALLDRASTLVASPAERTEVEHLRGIVELRCGRLLDACQILIAAAGATAPRDLGKALEILFDAGEAASWAGDHAVLGGIVDRVAALPASSTPGEAYLAQLLIGVGGLIAGKSEQGVPAVLDVVARADDFDHPRWLVWAAVGAGAVGQDAREAALLRRAVTLARASGAVDTLMLVLQVVAGLGLLEGRTSAAADAEEGLRLGREAGLSNGMSLHCAALARFAAIRGDQDTCQAQATEAIRLARANGAGFAHAVAEWSMALSQLGHGRPAEAIQRLEGLHGAAAGAGDPQILVLSTPDLVEASVRGGSHDGAERAFAVLAALDPATAPAWLLALVARCRALLADGPESDEHFDDALKLHLSWDRPFDRARTELLFGEHLRRQRRRVASREHLRSAIDGFDSLGALRWAERARSELRATGETSRGREPQAVATLTPQEQQIARLVRDGESNKDVAAHLFLSPRTVEYHLSKVFTKLGIASRSELMRHALVLEGVT